MKRGGKAAATETLKMREVHKKLQESQSVVTGLQEQMEAMTQELGEKEAERKRKEGGTDGAYGFPPSPHYVRCDWK